MDNPNNFVVFHTVILAMIWMSRILWHWHSQSADIVHAWIFMYGYPWIHGVRMRWYLRLLWDNQLFVRGQSYLGIRAWITICWHPCNCLLMWISLISQIWQWYGAYPHLILMHLGRVSVVPTLIGQIHFLRGIFVADFWANIGSVFKLLKKNSLVINNKSQISPQKKNKQIENFPSFSIATQRF